MLDLDKFLQIVPIWAHISQHDLKTAICMYFRNLTYVNFEKYQTEV